MEETGKVISHRFITNRIPSRWCGVKWRNMQ